MPEATISSILDDWERQYLPTAQNDRAVYDLARAEVEGLVREIARWLESGEENPDLRLREAFLDLSRTFRKQGVPTFKALEAMTVLEDILTASDLVADSRGLPGRKNRLRLALRGMLLEAVRMNTEMDARYSRERVDALEFFSEVLGHEIGNRLGAAQTASELLRDRTIEVDEERQAALLELISEGVEAALTSVEDVTALMVAHAREEEEMVPLPQVVEGVVRTVGPMARKEGVRLETPREIPTEAVDAARLRLVLTNLTLNGVRYSDLEEEARWVRIDAREDNGYLVLEVSDNGIGIDPKAHRDIFRYRERSPEGQARSETGSGLGLAVVAEAVSQMEGKLELESSPGVGSTFRLFIPRG